MKKRAVDVELECEGCLRKSKSKRLPFHGFISAEGGPVTGHIYENWWVEECEGVATCPKCGREDATMPVLVELDELRKRGLLKGLGEQITKQDMRHLIGRAERVVRAISEDLPRSQEDARDELTMATFKLSNTCKAWRKALKAKGKG